MSASDGKYGGNHGHTSAHHGAPPPPEPRTPMWLPALGALLFLLTGLAYGLSSWSSSDTPDASAPADAGAG